MENMNEIVTEVTENVAPTTEEVAEQVEQIESPVKTYTDEEVDEIVGKRIARREAKIRKEYDKKYGKLERVLKAGTGKDNVEELVDTFKEFYQKNGIQIPEEPRYSERDIEVLGRAEADDIIKSGMSDVIEEVDRLADLGLGNMSPTEKVVFKTLAEYRRTEEQNKELAKLGVTEDVYNGKEFKDFARKFASDTPMAEIYQIYSKMQPKKDIKPMGSMRSNTVKDTGVKDFYTRDEALQFTKKDFDNNPELFKAVERSMYKW